MAASLDELLKKMIDVEASDLHLKVGSPPVMRIDGELHPTSLPMLLPNDTEEYAQSIFTQRAAGEFREMNEADFAYGKAELGRFRVNVFRQRGSVSLVLRRVLPTTQDFAELGLPPVLEKLAAEARGLVLVTGPTGSGKTTTLASMIDHINQTRRVQHHHHRRPDRGAAPRQARHHQPSARSGSTRRTSPRRLRRALRQDPDVILIGEMRDAETVEAALQAAETGHLVLSTLHTIDATETINRIIDFFPPYQQQQIRILLGSTLKGVVSQRLLEKSDGGRAPAVEIMTMNGRVFDRIVDSTQTHSLVEVIRESEFYGMQTFDQSILNLFKNGDISFQTAMSTASNPHDFRVKAEQEGIIKV